MTPHWKDLLRTPLRLRGSQDAQSSLANTERERRSKGDGKSQAIALSGLGLFSLPRLASTLTKTLNAEGLGLKPALLKLTLEATVSF
jgi:hypothetical protein